MKNSKTFIWSLTVALAGFLFGFDTVVISGADLALKNLWQSTDLFHGVIVMSSALWGTVIGAIFGAIPTEKMGRKNTLIWIGALYLVSALGSSLVSDPWLFACFRFIGGLGVGASTIAAPAYISEISSAENRGRLVALYQFNIVFGIMIAFLSNYLLSGIEVDAWRWMIGIEALPALIYCILVFTVPKSPRWLILNQDDIAGAKDVFKQILPPDQIDHEVSQIVNAQHQVNAQETLFSKKYKVPVMLAFMIAFFNQFSGINALLYYAPRIFAEAGLGESTALLSSFGIGIVNLIFTLIGLSLIDKLGRKRLMYIGSVGYILSLGSVGFAFLWGASGYIVPILLFVFIASHAIGQGAVIWVFISEIFPNHLRSKGQAFGSGTHWVLAAAIPSMVPFLFTNIGPAAVFFVFAFMMILQLLWVWKFMPETKGVSLEEMQQKF